VASRPCSTPRGPTPPTTQTPLPYSLQHHSRPPRPSRRAPRPAFQPSRRLRRWPPARPASLRGAYLPTPDRTPCRLARMPLHLSASSQRTPTRDHARDSPDRPAQSPSPVVDPLCSNPPTRRAPPPHRRTNSFARDPLAAERLPRTYRRASADASALRAARPIQHPIPAAPTGAADRLHPPPPPRQRGCSTSYEQEPPDSLPFQHPPKPFALPQDSTLHRARGVASACLARAGQHTRPTPSQAAAHAGHRNCPPPPPTTAHLSVEPSPAASGPRFPRRPPRQLHPDPLTSRLRTSALPPAPSTLPPTHPPHSPSRDPRADQPCCPRAACPSHTRRPCPPLVQRPPASDRSPASAPTGAPRTRIVSRDNRGRPLPSRGRRPSFIRTPGSSSGVRLRSSLLILPPDTHPHTRRSAGGGRTPPKKQAASPAGAWRPRRTSRTTPTPPDRSRATA